MQSCASICTNTAQVCVYYTIYTLYIYISKLCEHVYKHGPGVCILFCIFVYMICVYIVVSCSSMCTNRAQVCVYYTIYMCTLYIYNSKLCEHVYKHGPGVRILYYYIYSYLLYICIYVCYICIGPLERRMLTYADAC